MRPLRLLALALAALALSGCLRTGPEDASARETPTPAPAPPEKGSERAPFVLLQEDFALDPVATGWRVGIWDAQRTVTGEHGVEDGRLALQLGGGGNAGYGLAAPLPYATHLVAEAVVDAAVLHRFGLYLVGAERRWTGVEMDEEGFCMCGWNGAEQTVTWFGEPRTGEPVTLRIELRDDGTATARASGLDGTLLGERSASGLGRASDVREVYLAVWADTPEAPRARVMVDRLLVVEP